MRKRNGFTLTEILVVIAMIAVVGTIIIVNTIAINNRSKDNEFNRMVENVKNATKTYVSLYPDDFSDLYSSKAFTYVSLKKVVKAGLLDEETINPYTKNPINLEDEFEGYVKVYVDGDSYEMVYTYPLTADDYNTQYWLQTTSITSNETEEKGFDVIYAYEGIQPNSKKATTNFAFSNEQGNLIQPSMTPELNAKYTSVLAMYKDMFNLSYAVPPSFDQCSETNEKCKKAWEDNHPDGATIQDYYIPQKTGTYEIKYNWSYTNSQGKTILDLIIEQ
jgi:prepilin-type N-terminal cleavage/methylation domain-containing protein